MNTRLHTLNELQEDLNLKLFNIDRNHQNNKFNIEDVGDFLHIGLLINHRNGNNVYMNSASCNILNYTLDEIEALGTGYKNSGLFDEDELKRITPNINGLYERNDETEVLSFFQRIKPQGNNDFKWMFITSKLFKRNDEFTPKERLLVACPVDMMGNMSKKINRVLDENEYMKKNFQKFASLTKREKEILSMVANGNQNPTIAEKLFISRHTVEQHRKNIRSKIGLKKITDIIKFADTFDII